MVIGYMGDNMVSEEVLEVTKSDYNLDNVKYCKGCGKEWKLDKDICCKGSEWFDESFNSAMKKYVELYKSDELRNYYDKTMKSKPGGPRMNKKRMIFRLMNHKDKLEVDEKTIGKILSHL